MLQVLCPDWKQKIKFTSDGDPTLDGHVGDNGVSFQEAADSKILRFWCGLHQPDVLVHDEYKKSAGEEFVEGMNSLIEYLRHQKTLQTQMKTTCPRFVSAR